MGKRFVVRHYGIRWRVFDKAYQLPLTDQYDTEEEANEAARRRERHQEPDPPEAKRKRSTCGTR
jgi:hypothetical protein